MNTQQAPILRSSLSALTLALWLASPAPAQINWIQASPATTPPAGSLEFSMAYDAGRSVSVMRTASPFGGQTWEYDGLDWQSIQTAAAPGAGQGTAMTYDATRGVIVLHGGADVVNNAASTETWEYDGANWTLVTSAGPAVVEATMTHDPTTNRVVLFGGSDLQGNTFTDTWEFDGVTASWTRITGASGPTVFNQMAFAFDPAAGTSILFGGQYIPPVWGESAETWEYDSSSQSWTLLFPTMSPSARRGLRAIYDAGRGGVLFHGGQTGSTTHADTWVYDAGVGSWSQLVGAAGPDRDNPLMAYDLARGDVLLFGGWQGAPVSANTNQTWLLGGGIPLSHYCFGDGSGTGCPCGNVGGTGEGCANSSGAGGTLAAVGNPSVSTHALSFVAGNLLASQPALLFAGLNQVNGGAGNLFGDGLRCAGNTVVRLGTEMPDLQGSATWGPSLMTTGGFVAGETRYFQSWYRDPQGSPCGALFNLTHGVAISFTP